MKKYMTQFLSLLLSLTLSFSVYSVYDCFSSGMGFVIGFLTILTTIAFFFLCYFTDRHHFIGGIIIMVVLYFCLQIYSSTAIRGYYAYNQSFIEWLLTKGSEVEGTYYLWTLYIFFTTFFSITVYYFSNSLYRMFFLTVVSLIPAILYLKVLAEMDNVFLVLTVLLNIAIFISHRRNHYNRGINPFFGNTLISSTIFILLIVLLISLIPKSTKTPYYDVFEDAFLGGDTSSPIGEDFSQLNSYSGDAGGLLSLSFTNRKLYTITCSSPRGFVTYMKRQNFDYYDFEKDHWYADTLYQDAKITPEEYEEAFQYINIPSLQSAMMAADRYEPGFLDKYGLSDADTFEFPPSIKYTLRIISENFSAIYYLAPTQCLNVDVTRNEPYYATAHGAFYSEKTPHPSDFIYTTDLYNDSAWRNMWLSHGGCSISNEDASQMLWEMDEILKAQNDPLSEISEAFLILHRNAQDYHERCQENTDLISPKLKAFALSLTDGLTNDFDKAMAIANFFHQDEFVYDLEYRPKDNSPEYFVFTGKRGSCSDFATAYTLLARAAGLTVRYAEGYVIEPGNNSHTYVIKSRDSHAYPEVYLPNMGWVVFEPTVARLESMESHFSLMNFITDLKMDYGLIAVIVVFVILGMAFIIALRFLMPVIAEILFRVRLRFSSCDSAVLLAYNRIVKKAARNGIPEAASHTPFELACLLEKTGCDMSPLAFMAEQILYGGATLPEEKKAELFAVYQAVSMALFKYHHDRKRKKDAFLPQ